MKERLGVLVVTGMMLVICNQAIAQTHVRIYHRGGGHSDVPIEEIDSITFVDGNKGLAKEAELSGSWLWGNKEAGYYELLTFNEDRTYTGYDNYFSYSFDTMAYGWYFLSGAMLTLQSNGYGYNRRYNWYVMGLTENALDVMTKMGQFTYYKLQPEVISLGIGETLSCSEGDSFIFANGITASINDNKLKGVVKGTTYILKLNTSSNTIVAYKVVVEPK